MTIPVRAWVNQTTIAGLSVRSPMVQMSEAVLVVSVTSRYVRPLREPSDLGPALSTRLSCIPQHRDDRDRQSGTGYHEHPALTPQRWMAPHPTRDPPHGPDRPP